jgi:putative ubiquitin-RnfH superfamily antitoxin RatB of RatAB toxin-antitoxin module
MKVEVVYSPAAREVESETLELSPGSTLADALGSSEIARRFAHQWRAADDVGVWGRRCALDSVLREGDRVEIYRALKVEPKEARRRRFASQGGAQKKSRR